MFLNHATDSVSHPLGDHQWSFTKKKIPTLDRSDHCLAKLRCGNEAKIYPCEKFWISTTLSVLNA